MHQVYRPRIPAAPVLVPETGVPPFQGQVGLGPTMIFIKRSLPCYHLTGDSVTNSMVQINSLSTLVVL